MDVSRQVLRDMQLGMLLRDTQGSVFSVLVMSMLLEEVCWLDVLHDEKSGAWMMVECTCVQCGCVVPALDATSKEIGAQRVADAADYGDGLVMRLDIVWRVCDRACVIFLLLMDSELCIMDSECRRR